MKIAGIIAEYNPFHSGHALHIEKTREKCGEDTAVVCVMSGSFVQRGEPAILSKRARAEMALVSGADLVLENPTVWAVSSAERFAAGGVAVLQALNLPIVLSFGSECGDIEKLQKSADFLGSDAVREGVKLAMKAGISYAAAREKALAAVYREGAELLRGPNNILGVEYLKAISALGAEKIEPFTFQRIATEHDGAESGSLAPASRLRELIRVGGDVSPYIPEAAHAILSRELEAGLAPANINNIEAAILYRLRTMGEEEFAALPDASEGVWRRLMAAGRREASLDTVLSSVKSKRYALSRIRRMVAAAALGISAEDQRGLPPYIRVLGCNERGREVLRLARTAAKKPLITKPATAKLLDPEAREIFDIDVRATDLFRLALNDPENRLGGTEWTYGPVIM